MTPELIPQTLQEKLFWAEVHEAERRLKNFKLVSKAMDEYFAHLAELKHDV